MYLDTHTGMWHKPITHGDIPVGRRSHSACKLAFKHIFYYCCHRFFVVLLLVWHHLPIQGSLKAVNIYAVAWEPE